MGKLTIAAKDAYKKAEEALMCLKKARSRGLAAFRSLHPKETIPKWFSDCATIRSIENYSNYDISIIVYPKAELRDGEFWETRNRRRVLARIDPKSGRKSIVISHNRQGSPIVVFKAEFDAAAEKVDVVVDTDISKMDECLYEPIPWMSLNTDPEW